MTPAFAGTKSSSLSSSSELHGVGDLNLLNFVSDTDFLVTDLAFRVGVLITFLLGVVQDTLARLARLTGVAGTFLGGGGGEGFFFILIVTGAFLGGVEGEGFVVLIGLDGAFLVSNFSSISSSLSSSEEI